MSEIHGISAKFLQIYHSFQKRGMMSPKEMFYNLSIELGGDGKTITKKQLDDYLDKVANGQIKVGKTKLRALKMMQQNWDTISKDKDYITLDDMKEYQFLLVMVAYGDSSAPDEAKAEAEEEEKREELQPKIEDILKKIEESEDPKEALKAILKDLLSGTTDENDDLNANLIDALTNLVSLETQNFTVEAEA